ncbi:helix-turn-helix domain-containing protein [Streptomyces sp. NPDC048483]|uniref:helix-turn-helix domain-containing protein n=1 Tax=Streptomyces sp. NPDC048483 TaxID=3154927 RepID=UPI00341DD963
MRVQIVLHAARGMANARIAERAGVHVDTVRTWRGRLTKGGLAALAGTATAPAARPPPPRCRTLRSRRWHASCPPRPGFHCPDGAGRSCPELAREAITRGIATGLSASTVRRWLTRDAIKPEFSAALAA